VPLEKLLDNLNDNFFNTPLPCRSDEILTISEFIEKSYIPDCPVYDPHKRGRKPRALNDLPTPSLLYITGNPGTGKTECVRYCIQQARAPSVIKYINCKMQKVELYTETDPTIPRIIVLDEIEAYSDFAEIANNSLLMRYNLICISNAHENEIVIQKASGLQVQQLVFKSYTLDELVQILTSRIGGKTKSINDTALKYLANHVMRDRGDARAAIIKLSIVIGSAIQEGLTTISFDDMTRLVNYQKVPIKYELPLYPQIALIAIYRSGKNWIKTFHKIISKKGYEPYNDMKGVFDQLSNYPDLVKGSFKKPITAVPKETITASVDAPLRNEVYIE
jgi:Cdc6-like AAA superfamily ATPase